MTVSCRFTQRPTCCIFRALSFGPSLQQSHHSHKRNIFLPSLDSSCPEEPGIHLTNHPKNDISFPMHSPHRLEPSISTAKQRPCAELTIRTPLIRRLRTHIHAPHQTIPPPLHLCQQPATQRPGLQNLDAGRGEPRVPPEFQLGGVGSGQGVGFVLDPRGPGLMGDRYRDIATKSKTEKSQFRERRAVLDRRAGRGRVVYPRR